MLHALKRTRRLVAVCFLHPSTSSKHYIIQHTQSVSVPIRHPSDKGCSVLVVTSFETDIYRPIYIHRKYQIPGPEVHTYAVYSCVWRLWVVFLEHGGGALGIFKSPVCTKSCNQAWAFSSASHYFSFLLSKRSGRRMPPAERSALYILRSIYIYIPGM